MSQDRPLYVLDGNSLVFRAFFAVPADLVTSSGTVTNAVHGFTSMLVNLLRDHMPSGLAVAFDRPEPTFRDTLVADYKGNRPETPELLGPQFNLVRVVLDALGIARIELPGYEADDILATLATEARDRGQPVVVVSGDRDVFQLVEDPLVRVMYTRRGISDTVMYDEAGIFERCGVTPDLYPILASLRGDPSDNLPGVPGVGEKTAAKLVSTYRSLDAIYANLDAQTPKLKENLAASEARVRLNAQVIPLLRDAPLGIHVDDLHLGRWDADRVRQTFLELELRTLWDRLAPIIGSDPLGSGVSGGVGSQGPSSGASPVSTSYVDTKTQARADRVSCTVALRPKDAFEAAEIMKRVLESFESFESFETNGGEGSDSDGSGVMSAELEPADWDPTAWYAVPPEQLGYGPDRPARVLAGVPVWLGEPGHSDLQGLAVAVVERGQGGGSDEPVVWLEASWLSVEPLRSVLAGHLSGRSPSRGEGSVGGVCSNSAVAPLPLVVHDAKGLVRWLMSIGLEVGDLWVDTALAAYLLDPNVGRPEFDSLVNEKLGFSLGSHVGAVPVASDSGQLALVIDDSSSEADERDGAGADSALEGKAAQEAVALGMVVEPLLDSLAARHMARLLREVEVPLVSVLARMELRGIGVDREELQRINVEMSDECRRLEAEIHELAGEVFNVNSTPQLRAVLYDRLGLVPGKKTKTGYSTDAATLEKLRDAHPIVATLLRYREVEKLRSTYGTSLMSEVGDDGRIHATFHQTVARTGRLSSDRPNLHNIPVRSVDGLRLRRAFVPAPVRKFLIADYDQIELRVIAHLSGDSGLVGAFEAGEDIHRATAARVFAVLPDQVTSAQRNRAKMVSYGLAYGMEAYGLGQRLSISTGEAQEILDAYFEAFPAVREAMDVAVAVARERGYTETLFGRRRPLADLHSPNRGLRMAAERQAMNAGIQGVAADLFKLALVRLDRALETGGFESVVVLQVHDEVILEVPGVEEVAMSELVAEVLGGVGDEVSLSVPLKVSIGFGRTWADAKG